MDHKEKKMFVSKELSYEEKYEIVSEIGEVLQKNKLSLTQANEILELVKEGIATKPLWD